MKFLSKRNLNYKQSYIKNEFVYLILKYILYSEKFPLSIRLKANLFLSNKKNFLIKYRNRCFLTQKGYSFLNFVQLSRISFRDKAANNELPFIKKASW